MGIRVSSVAGKASAADGPGDLRAPHGEHPRPLGDGDQGHVGVAPAAVTAAIVPRDNADRSFCLPVPMVLQPAPALPLAGHQGSREEEPPQKKRRGLNPFLMFSNRALHAARACAGRTLTKEEVCEVREGAKLTWGRLSDDDKQTHRDLYDEWLASGSVEGAPADALAPPPYTPLWAGGCRASPVSASELYNWHQRHGWPTDHEIYTKKDARITASTMDFDQSSGFDCFGCLRGAHNICKTVLANTPGYDVAHNGMTNFLESLDRREAESGTVLVVLEGLDATDGSATRWTPFLITGTCWSPKVFEAALNHFVVEEHARAARLDFPVDVAISVRASRLTERYRCIAEETSAHVVYELVRTFRQVVLHKAEYTLPMIDGSLRFSRIIGMQRVGVLWQVGLTKPLLADVIAKQRKAQRQAHAALRRGDPLSATSSGAGRRARSSRGRGRGRGGGGRGQARPPTEPRDVDPRPFADGPVEPAEAADGPAAAEEEGDFEPACGADAAPAGCRLDEEYDVVADGDEHGQLMTSDEDEFEVSLAEIMAADDGEDIEAAPAVGAHGGIQATDGARIAEVAAEEAVMVGLDGGIADEAPATEAGEAMKAADAQAEHASGSVAQPPPTPPEPQLPRLPPGIVGPCPRGYILLDGALFLRVQRGNPRGQLSVKCYWHNSCSWLLPLRLAPSDEDIIRWGLELPSTRYHKDAAVSRQMGQRHCRSAERFRAQAAPAGQGGTAASSTAPALATGSGAPSATG